MANEDQSQEYIIAQMKKYQTLVYEKVCELEDLEKKLKKFEDLYELMQGEDYDNG